MDKVLLLVPTHLIENLCIALIVTVTIMYEKRAGNWMGTHQNTLNMHQTSLIKEALISSASIAINLQPTKSRKVQWCRKFHRWKMGSLICKSSKSYLSCRVNGQHNPPILKLMLLPQVCYKHCCASIDKLSTMVQQIILLHLQLCLSTAIRTPFCHQLLFQVGNRLQLHPLGIYLWILLLLYKMCLVCLLLRWM